MNSRAAKWIALAGIGFVAVSAGLLNAGFAGMRGLRYVGYLGQWEAFHVVAHLIIFFSLAAAAGLWASGRRYLLLVAGLVIGATALIEITQLITLDIPLSGILVTSSLYDLLINSLGACTGIIVILLLRRWAAKRAEQ